MSCYSNMVKLDDQNQLTLVVMADVRTILKTACLLVCCYPRQIWLCHYYHFTNETERRSSRLPCILIVRQSTKSSVIEYEAMWWDSSDKAPLGTTLNPNPYPQLGPSNRLLLQSRLQNSWPSLIFSSTFPMLNWKRLKDGIANNVLKNISMKIFNSKKYLSTLLLFLHFGNGKTPLFLQ